MSTFLRWMLAGCAAWMIAGAPQQAAAVPGDVFYVDQFNDSGIENGRTWATAFTEIQPAIEAARQAFGGEVWVAGGVYDENRPNAGALRLRPGVQVYGGFVGGEVARNQRDFRANLTIIDGLASDNGEPAEAVVLGANDARLDGFIVRGGRAVSGGGMLNVSVSPTVANCTFTGNEAEEFGAGVINVDGAAPRFIHCTFIGNVTPGSGGAMGVVDSAPVIEHCRFIDNDAREAGGALFITGDSTVLVRHTLFEENTSVTGGAAIFNDGGILSVEACEFYGNVTEGFGGMVFNNEGSDTLVVNTVAARNSAGTGGAAISSLGARVTSVNCTFADNTTPVDGSVLHNNNSETNVVNAVIWYNSHPPFFNLDSFTSIRWSNVGGGDRGPNNIAIEPRFVNRDANDYRLRNGSPSIDAGTSQGAPATDIRGVSRPQGNGIDMGAYEMQDAVPGGPDCKGIVGAATPTGGPGNGETLLVGLLFVGFFAARRRIRRTHAPIAAA